MLNGLVQVLKLVGVYFNLRCIMITKFFLELIIFMYLLLFLYAGEIKEKMSLQFTWRNGYLNSDNEN